MVLVPVATPLATPALVIVATEVFEELQVTVLVRFRVLPSLYAPVAVNGCVAPLAIDGFAGVTAIDDSTAVTVSVVDPMTEPDAAWIVLAPTPTALAAPLPVTVAIEVFEELQLTEFVRFCVEPSL